MLDAVGTKCGKPEQRQYSHYSQWSRTQKRGPAAQAEHKYRRQQDDRRNKRSEQPAAL